MQKTCAKFSAECADKVSFGDIVLVDASQAYIPLVCELTGEPIHGKTPLAYVAGYDPSTATMTLRFEQSPFLDFVQKLNDRVVEHVCSIKQRVYGDVSDDQLLQVFRPFVIDDMVFLYTWTSSVVHKDGTEVSRDLSSLIGTHVKLSFDIRGISLQPNIFGPAAELSKVCVIRERPAEPEADAPATEEPEPAPEGQVDTFSDDEEDVPKAPPSIFKGIEEVDDGFSLNKIPRD